MMCIDGAYYIIQIKILLFDIVYGSGLMQYKWDHRDIN